MPKKVPEQVAASLGLDEVYSELIPADKVGKEEELLKTKSEREKLAFVGVGSNDAPVLRRQILVLRWAAWVLMLPLNPRILF